jgi:hypothetical protein
MGVPVGTIGIARGVFDVDDNGIERIVRVDFAREGAGDDLVGPHRAEARAAKGDGGAARRAGNGGAAGNVELRHPRHRGRRQGEQNYNDDGSDRAAGVGARQPCLTRHFFHSPWIILSRSRSVKIERGTRKTGKKEQPETPSHSTPATH